MELYICIIRSRSSWNSAKVGIKHQSINQPTNQSMYYLISANTCNSLVDDYEII
jgi:hypothetical protein